MEAKVIDSLLIDKESLRFNKNFSFNKEEGSGNNWGYGYHNHGKICYSAIKNKMNKVLENTDYIQNFVFF